jgi:SAM-dependent methyltransferase
VRDAPQLCCVECSALLDIGLHCAHCGTAYERAPTGAPILMTADDRRKFNVLLNRDEGRLMQATYERRRKRDWTRRFYPPEPVYVNPQAPALPAARPGICVWIGGAGLDLPGFVNLDVAPAVGVDIVANASRLPFLDSSCDLIACLALLEHVSDPDQVVREIHRVLKPAGEAQVVVPFCHPYHAYPADYSRFSRENLQRLFSDFRDVDIGIRTGPTTTMLTFLTYYLKLILPVHCPNRLRRTANRLIVGGAGWLMFPLKYLDAWLNHAPDAHVLANHLYVSVRK